LVYPWGVFDASGAELQEAAGRVEGNVEEVSSGARTTILRGFARDPHQSKDIQFLGL
jgi:hypothetical protein